MAFTKQEKRSIKSKARCHARTLLLGFKLSIRDQFELSFNSAMRDYALFLVYGESVHYSQSEAMDRICTVNF